MPNNLLDTNKLETLLIKNWTELFDVRDMLKHVQNIIATYLPSNETNRQINHLSVSRFEPTPQGFILWLTYTIIEKKTKYKAISEILLNFNGEAQHIMTHKES
jgi:hypothetical protein